jgi:hypothetical protein
MSGSGLDTFPRQDDDDLSEARVRQVAAETARRLDADQPQLVRAMSDLLAREIDELDSDPRLMELLVASVDGNTKTLIHILANDIPVEHLRPTTAAVEYALRLAQRGIPAASLIRAYHMGQDSFRQRCFVELQRGGHPPELRLLAMDRIAAVLHRYIDWITQYLIDEYERERARWLSSEETVRSSLIHAVVAGQPVDHAGFEEGTGYRLDQWHVGLVVWTASSAPSAGAPVGTAADEHRALESFVRRLTGSLGCARAPLVTAVDRSTAWAWLPMRPAAGAAGARSLDLTAVRAFAGANGRLRMTLGLAAHGEAGFRRTHEQAQEARTVALMAVDRVPAAVSFGDEGVAIVAVMARDLERTRAWVAGVLGRLAVADENTAALRETMRVFLLTGDNYSRTADLLVLHRNTVKYRVSKVLEERGGSVDSNRLDVALALQACHFLGAPVLQPSPKAVRGSTAGGSPRGTR